MFQLDQVLEYWATKYKPIKHDPAAKSKDKGFFRIQEIDLQSEWSRNMNLIDKPCLLFRMAEDGQVNADNTNRLDRFWGIYLAVKQKGAPNNVVDELGSADCMTQWGLAPCVLSVMAHWCLSPSCAVL